MKISIIYVVIVVEIVGGGGEIISHNKNSQSAYL